MIRVMIVDDSILARKALEKSLSDDPEITVVGMASNGKEALSKVPEFNPEVMTCDIEMPEMDGVETLMHMRKQFPQVKVIILSSISQPNSPKESICKNLGAAAVLAKPVEHSNLKIAEKKDELIQTIKRI